MALLRMMDFSSSLRYSPVCPKRSKKVNCDTFFMAASFFLLRNLLTHKAELHPAVHQEKTSKQGKHTNREVPGVGKVAEKVHLIVKQVFIDK